jgi:ribosomal protein S16
MEVLGTYDPKPRIPLATADEDEGPGNDTPAPRQLDFRPQAQAKAQARARTQTESQEAKPVTQPKRYKDIHLDQSRTKYWLGVGAQPSEPVERLLCMVSFFSSRLLRLPSPVSRYPPPLVPPSHLGASSSDTFSCSED